MKGKRVTKEQRLSIIIKWIIYAILMSICYVYSTTAVYGETKPLLLIPLALCISMKETEVTAALVGLFCGLMMDASGGKIFGFNAILLMLACMFTALMFLHLLRQNIINIIWITAIATGIMGCLDFFFYYAIWDQENVWKVFLWYTLPSMIFTILFSGLVYLVIKFIIRRVSVPDRHFIEEKSENIVRE